MYNYRSIIFYPFSFSNSRVDTPRVNSHRNDVFVEEADVNVFLNVSNLNRIH